MAQNDEDDDPPALFWDRCLIMCHRISRFAHSKEHHFHLLYFGALSTGVGSYKMAAAGCLIIGILALLPGAPE